MHTYQMTHIMDKILFALYRHDFNLFISRANNMREKQKKSLI